MDQTRVITLPNHPLQMKYRLALSNTTQQNAGLIWTYWQGLSSVDVVERFKSKSVEYSVYCILYESV